MTSFNSVPVDKDPACCGSAPVARTVENTGRPQQTTRRVKCSVRFGFTDFCTVSTGPSATTLFFFDSSNN
jgi:hypothetical protein